MAPKRRGAIPAIAAAPSVDVPPHPAPTTSAEVEAANTVPVVRSMSRAMGMARIAGSFSP